MQLLYLLMIMFLGLAAMIGFVVVQIDSQAHANYGDLKEILRKKSASERDENSQVKLNEKHENIFWIVQITDFHISLFRDRQRGPDLIDFCKTYLSVIKPEIILATGDLVDAKEELGTGSRQFVREWQQYYEILHECSKYHSAKWLDVRGNHDSFDVPDLQSKENLHRQYSAQGHTTSYKYIHNTKFGKYGFVSVDACPDPGPKRPFNFFGQLNDDQLVKLKKLSEETRDTNQTLWFGHYPTSLIVQDPPGLKHVMRRGLAYVCGHLHTLNGMVHEMYTRHKTGTLELELGDWRDNRMFRVMAIDHDLLSFVDATLGDWPLVIITNPKHALFQTETHEPLHRIEKSTHIRVLIFHPLEIKSVAVFIDKQYLGEASHVQGPLYVLKWNPHAFGLNVHTIALTITDVDGTRKEVVQPFSIDGSRPDFRLAPRLILMMNLSTVGKVMFALLVFAYIMFLGFLRQCTNIRNFFLQGETLVTYYLNRWLWKLWLTATTNCVYYPLLGALLYLTFGPWFVGDFLQDHFGILFVWGIYVKGVLIPGSFTYFYGFFQVLTFNVPLLFHVSHTLDLNYFISWNLKEVKQRQIPSSVRITHIYLPFICLLVFHLFLTLTEFPRAYGTKTLYLGPVRTGSVLLLIYLQYVLFNVPLKGHMKCTGQENHIS